ncbi:MAG: type II toxin-antitoxin system VapC family toxin [Candidatus Aminicenantes bacterium]|nr:type II toxin-antitoxin system VapC family toxin [Candidatus Aminicenantes bacterium]
MSGKNKRFILDTNAIVSLLKGNKDLHANIETAEWVGISIISKIEFLAFPGLSEPDSELFKQFLKRIEVIGLNDGDKDLMSNIIKIRKSRKSIKLPDAIIISSALVNNCVLVTADRQLHNLDEIEVIGFEP